MGADLFVAMVTASGGSSGGKVGISRQLLAEGALGRGAAHPHTSELLC